MPFDPDTPYNDLPLLPPKAELETKAVLRKAIAANKALAELKGAGDLIPNQGVLINAIVLQEAKLSSEIAGRGTGEEEVGQAGHMFAKRTCRGNMSKKAGFLDMSQKHFQTRRGHLLWVAGLCFGAIPVSRHMRAGQKF
jgi:Fic/DOC family N-terminal